MTFIRVEETAVESRDIHDRTERFNLLGAHQASRLHSHGLEYRPGGLEPLPSLGRARQVYPTSHVQTHALAALHFELAIKVNGVRLEGGDIGVSIDGVKSACGVPR